MTENADKKIFENPEVAEKAARRRFTSGYKRCIALEAEACTQPGEIDALLRREGEFKGDAPQENSKGTHLNRE